jgi:hypothetical protein
VRHSGGVRMERTGGSAEDGRAGGTLTVIVFLFWRGRRSPSHESLRFPSLPDSFQAEEPIFC